MKIFTLSDFFLKVKFLFENIFFNLVPNTYSLTGNGLKFKTTSLKYLKDADDFSVYM